MKSAHYFSIAVALALAGVLFWKGNLVAPKKQGAATAPMARPGMPGGEKPPAARFDSLLTVAKKKMSPQVLAMLSEQELLTKGQATTPRITAFDSMGKLWQKARYPAIAAFYFSESAKLDNSEKKFNFAAHLYTEALKEEKNPEVRQWMAEGAIDCYNHSLAVNPDNDSVRMDLAAVYMNGTGEPMKGVQELLSIVRKDSANLPANLMLGGMAIESGQYDKAIERGELILRYHKDSWQARLFMAEAYNAKGDRTKAVQLLQEAKALNKDPEFGRSVDEYLNQDHQH